MVDARGRNARVADQQLVILRQPQIRAVGCDALMQARLNHPAVEHPQALQLIPAHPVDAQRLPEVLPFDQHHRNRPAIEPRPFDRVAQTLPQRQPLNAKSSASMASGSMPDRSIPARVMSSAGASIALPTIHEPRYAVASCWPLRLCGFSVQRAWLDRLSAPQPSDASKLVNPSCVRIMERFFFFTVHAPVFATRLNRPGRGYSHPSYSAPHPIRGYACPLSAARYRPCGHPPCTNTSALPAAVAYTVHESRCA